MRIWKMNQCRMARVGSRLKVEDRNQQKYEWDGTADSTTMAASQ